MSTPITDEEREAGGFRLWFGFGSHNVRHKTLAEIFEQSPGSLIEIGAWRKLDARFPAAKVAIERYLAVPRIAAIVAEIAPKVRGKKAARFKAKAAFRQTERDLLDRQMEYGGRD